MWRHSELTHFLVVNARMDPWTDQGALLRPLDPSKPPISEGRKPTANSKTMRDLRLVEAERSRSSSALAMRASGRSGRCCSRRAGVEPSRCGTCCCR